MHDYDLMINVIIILGEGLYTVTCSPSPGVLALMCGGVTPSFLLVFQIVLSIFEKCIMCRQAKGAQKQLMTPPTYVALNM